MIIINTIKTENYPDVLSIDNIQEILGIGKNNVYTLLKDNTIKSIKVGKKYIVPKTSIYEFLKIS